MPYIPEVDREKFNEVLEDSFIKLRNSSAGEKNYFISTLIWKLFTDSKNYNNANELIGVLECVKAEFYRRQVVPYEHLKLAQNGDLQ